MERRTAVNLIAAVGAAAALRPRRTFAQATPSPYEGPLTPSEQSFYERASAALQKLYPNPAAAERVGYFRYTNEDRTGAISYENIAYFNTPDLAHPQQLWYDVNGRLLGGDWSQTVASAPNGPNLFGIGRGRFHHVALHIHFGLYNPNGTIRNGLFVAAADYRTQVGDPLLATPEGLVKMGKATAPEQVAFVFPLLENWDAQMWVIANPAGQFASANPNVKPSPRQGGGDGEQRV